MLVVLAKSRPKKCTSRFSLPDVAGASDESMIIPSGVHAAPNLAARERRLHVTRQRLADVLWYQKPLV